MSSKVDQRTALTADEAAAVLSLASAAGDTDGAFPLSEHTVLHLRHGGDTPSVHLIAHDEHGDLAGYAHVDTTDGVDGPSAELVVHPLARRHGLGRALTLAALTAAAEADPSGRLRLWAHGDHPSASALALSLGFQRARVLWQMRRSLYAEVPQPVLPGGVVVRPFRPGDDEQPWLDLNARAFADHPEQGRWSLCDLHVRMAEPWFDPEGFLLAERDGRLVGFHWTKVHGELRGEGADGAGHDHDPIGEVYVLGVDPDAHGGGLGRALTAAGLRHLRARGLDQVMLYVDESNQAATSLYTRLGFSRWSTDVLFQRI
ncbi:mycothiol acetyltransferase [Catellatospora sp. TT07R-123]|uniref:mycothiol synthase n=1 Tax=Catellatospora sp. TT07R-123 TaxID=2733863 RepID=UPI001B1B0AA1|nr:mycothiol synthase [Catellatospora sp. TT07R-123]GHJ46323.1 mycothiol acetyltransferase [Catellatospora sp. TT07R-123]